MQKQNIIEYIVVKIEVKNDYLTFRLLGILIQLIFYSFKFKLCSL